MGTGQIIILLLVLLCTTLIIVFGKVNGKKKALLHCVVFIGYTIILLYNLHCNGSGGSSIVWLFYLIIALLLHIIFLLIAITKKLKSTKKLVFLALTIIAFLALVFFCLTFMG